MIESEPEFPLIMPLANYRVTINCHKVYEVATEKEAWDVIGRQRFGSGYMVDSPTGLPTDDFVPF